VVNLLNIGNIHGSLITIKLRNHVILSGALRHRNVRMNLIAQ